MALFEALMRPRMRGKTFAALSTPLFGWTMDELKNSKHTEFILLLIQQLRNSLKEKGFASFFHDLLHANSKPDGPTVLELILSRRDGLEFYRDLVHIADCIAEHQYLEWTKPEGILPFLDQFLLWEQNDDERIKRFENPTQEGIRILTLHNSKGLEFDVVFALGLMKRDSIKEELIPVEIDGHTMLSSIAEESLDYQHYCEERDSKKCVNSMSL